MPAYKDIALAFPRGTHQEKFIDGVLDYALKNDCRWTYATAPESLSLSILDLDGWQGDAVIAALNTEAEVQCARNFKLPVINISGAMVESPVPRVNIDNTLIGEMAADHLIVRGFSNFAFFGLTQVGYSQLREQGYRSRLENAGFQCQSYLAEPTFGQKASLWQEQPKALAKWLKSLPTPIALFAVTDYRARQVINMCNDSDIAVPQDIAVLGVDNEEVICQHVRPQLSSIARNDRLEGYYAATLLDKLMRGEMGEFSVSVPPVGIVERESTKVVATSDSRVREAINFVFRNLHKPFGVNDVASHLGVSRRWLEYTFREDLGESPYQYIRRQRLEYARRLLSEEPSTKIYEVAQRAGFNSAKRFMTVFRQNYGLSPREYRRSLQP